MYLFPPAHYAYICWCTSNLASAPDVINLTKIIYFDANAAADKDFVAHSDHVSYWARGYY